ncbi:MAG: HAD family hydrolase [Spirochaetaceae bacterium]
MKEIRAVLFDMDGTLIDSEPNYRIADERFFNRFGIELPEEVWEEFVGLGSAKVIEYVSEHYGLQGDPEELLAMKERCFHEIAEEGIEVFPATVRLLNSLTERGIPCGIATGSSKRTLDFSLKATGLEELFDATVSTDEVAEAKPAPDVFLEAARRLGVEPEHCLVLEDSRSGIMAAVAAGMSVVALPSVSSLMDDPLLREVDLLIPHGAASLEPERVLELIERRNGANGRAAG